MPSFRATLQIFGLKPGHAPEEVIDTAVAVVASLHNVEASQLDIVARIPRITVRFTVDPNEYDAETRLARTAAASMEHGVAQVADTGAVKLFRRQRGKWLAE